MASHAVRATLHAMTRTPAREPAPSTEGLGIEVLFDGNEGEGLTPSRIWVGSTDPGALLSPILCEVNGALCEIAPDPPPGLEGIGAFSCVPVDAKERSDWPGYIDVIVDGGTEPKRLEFATRDPVIVAAMGRYFALLDAGPRPVPTGTKLG